MDPNNQNSQGDNGAVNKLEQDLQNIKDQGVAAPQQPIPIEEPVQPFPQVPEVPQVVPAMSTPPVTPAETSAFVPESPKKGSPLMIIAIILAVVAVLAVVAYVFGAKLFTPKPTPIAVVTPTSTPDPTTNWKTYTNEKYMFTFKYPNELKEDDSPSQWGMPAFVSSDKSVNLHVGVLDYTGGGDSILGNEKYLRAQQYTNINTQTINGNSTTTAEYLKDESNGMVKYEAYIASKTSPSMLFLLELYSSTSNSESSKNNLDRILSTFKFIEATPSASPIASPTAEIKSAVTNYLKNNGHDMSKVTISEPQKLGTLTDVYSVGWTETGYTGGGQYVVIGKINGQWIIPSSGDATYCGWIKSAGLDEATKAFMGPTCGI